MVVDALKREREALKPAPAEIDMARVRAILARFDRVPAGDRSDSAVLNGLYDERRLPDDGEALRDGREVTRNHHRVIGGSRRRRVNILVLLDVFQHAANKHRLGGEAVAAQHLTHLGEVTGVCGKLNQGGGAQVRPTVRIQPPNAGLVVDLRIDGEGGVRKSLQQLL
jgi:hypothetical protein